MKKNTIFIFISILLIIIGILSTIIYNQSNYNKKLKKTVNLLIDDDFVTAEKQIKENKLYDGIDYNELVKKINNRPTIRLDKNSKTGKVIDWHDEYTCKRFNNNSEICK